MHWHERGSMIPPMAVSASALTWLDDTFFGSEVSAWEGRLHDKMINMETDVESKSRSLLNSMSLMMDENADMALLHPAYPLVDATGGGKALLSTNEHNLPTWWKETQQLWDGALKRAIANEGTAQCLYYCTPLGCQATPCCAWHDPQYELEVMDIKRRRGDA